MIHPIELTSGIRENEQNGGKTRSNAWIFCFLLLMELSSLPILSFVGTIYQQMSLELVLSVLFKVLGLSLVLWQSGRKKTLAGISLKSISLLAVSIVFRLSAELFVDGYKVASMALFDGSMPGMTKERAETAFRGVVDAISLLMAFKILLDFRKCVPCQNTYEADDDFVNTKNVVMYSVAMAIMIRVDMIGWSTYDIMWTAGLYVDAVAMIPQLVLMSKLGRMPECTVHYLSAMLVSRVFSALFWYHNTAGSLPSRMVILASHALQLGMLPIFGYCFMKWRSAGKVAP